MKKNIPFNRPFVTGREWHYIQAAIKYHHLSGDGAFTKQCHAWLEQRTGCRRAFLTHSGTAALEMAAILADIRPGDEIIMPSYTFVSTANAFVLRGGVPVFVDIREDTLNLDETKIEAAITPRTRAIVPVHYAGVACEMDAIMETARRHKLLVIEDAAQAILSTYRGRPLGSIGHLAALSFHETKNIHCGEGGALLINDSRFVERAEIIREKGTDRTRFFRGQVDKYTWVDVGSSYLPSELSSAFLWAQMEQAESITAARRRLWERYHSRLGGSGLGQGSRGPVVPEHCGHNAHMYYVLLRDLEARTRMLEFLSQSDINAVFHYVPLHSSAAGARHGRCSGGLKNVAQTSDRLLRLPLWVGMTDQQVDSVVERFVAGLGDVR